MSEKQFQQTALSGPYLYSNRFYAQYSHLVLLPEEVGDEHDEEDGLGRGDEIAHFCEPLSAISAFGVTGVQDLATLSGDMSMSTYSDMSVQWHTKSPTSIEQLASPMSLGQRLSRSDSVFSTKSTNSSRSSIDSRDMSLSTMFESRVAPPPMPFRDFVARTSNKTMSPISNILLHNQSPTLSPSRYSREETRQKG